MGLNKQHGFYQECCDWYSCRDTNCKKQCQEKQRQHIFSENPQGGAVAGGGIGSEIGAEHAIMNSNCSSPCLNKNINTRNESTDAQSEGEASESSGRKVN